VAAGHEVTASSRSRDMTNELRALGARPVVMDGLDSAAVGQAVAQADPDAIVHQMTALVDVLAELGEMASTRTRVILRGTATAIAQAGGRASSTAADAGHDLLRQLVEWLTQDQALVWPH
jgi:2-alkyl-3-oxoalkanoate reductase